MGLAPAGRCNDFARALGILAKPEAIVDTLVNGQPGPVDLGKVNKRYFCTVATVGIDAEVTSFVDSMKMPLAGTMAYLYGALRVLARYQPRSLRITGDFGVIEQPVFIASSANTSSYGGAIPIAPDAVPTDGQLDLCVIRHVSRLRAFTLVPTVLAGRHGSLPETRFIRTRRVQIDADKPLELWADGELMACTPAMIEVASGAVQVILPRRGELRMANGE
jgi:YegS/Rv2252/BmrU family lipid kinase